MASRSSRKLDDYMGAVQLVAVAAAVIMVRAAVAAETSCTTPDEFVFPFWSFCNSPATLSTGYGYVSVGSFGTGEGLEPEWDESNSTYYVRLSDGGGATYVASSEEGSHGLHSKLHHKVDATNEALLTNSTVYIYNADSGRVLQWRQEGSDEYFLIEKEVTSVEEGAPFQFLKADDVTLPCPLIYPPAQCNAYYLVSDPTASSSDPSTGLLAYSEGSATYIKNAPVGSLGDLPLALHRSDVAVKPGSTMPVLAHRY